MWRYNSLRQAKIVMLLTAEWVLRKKYNMA